MFPFFIFPYFDIYVFHLPVLSYFAWILCYGVGALDDRGETDVRTARDPGIPIKFTPSTPHCSAVQIHPNTNTPTAQRSRALAVFEGWLSAAHCWGLSCLLLSESGLWEYLSWYKANDRDGDDDDNEVMMMMTTTMMLTTMMLMTTTTMMMWECPAPDVPIEPILVAAGRGQFYIGDQPPICI